MVDFRYYINRQGPRGQQGVKGEQGYSPQIIVGKNTSSEFTLKVINEDGSFETENLKAVPENRGGTYVRYDKDTYQEYIGDPDIATTRTFGVVRLATKEDLETQEESRAVTSALLDTYLQENYLNKVHGDVVTGDVSFRGDTGFLNAPHIDKIKDENNNQYITRNVPNETTEVGSLTIPDDITARMIQGGKEIAYTSDLAEFVTNAVLNNTISNLVTLDTPQTITGNKTFTGLSTIQGDTYITKYLILDTKNSQNPAIAISDGASLTPILTPTNNGLTLGNFLRTVTFAGDVKLSDGNFVLGQGSITAGDNITLERTEKGVKISSTVTGDVTLAGDNSFTGNNTFDGVSTFNGDTWVNSLKVGTSLTNQQDKKFLAQGSITAGSDNLVIADTTDGVKITCNAPTNAQIEALQRLINDLSTKVDNLTTRLNNLEEVIDGGIA